MTGAPERRVLRGDAGAPLDTDRVLAIALRWADRPLTMDHVKVGVPHQPLDGVEVKWEGSLPIFALADGTRAWVERESGKWNEAGRRVGLEIGEVLLVESGQLTLEARVQKRSERLIPSKVQENTFFGLIVAHSLMIFGAVATAMVITPQTDDESIWGNAQSFLRATATPWMPAPKRKEPVIEERINEQIAKNATAAFTPVTQQKPQTANNVLKLLFGGGGGFGGGLGAGINAAIESLNGPGAPQGGDGMGGLGKDLGAGIGPGAGMGVGPLSAAKIPGGGLPGGLRGKRMVDIVCAGCAPSLPPGYDRDLVLKVVRRHQNQIRFCYESELNKSPDLAGKITVAWTIDGAGAVSVAQIAESGLKNESVESCILSRVRSWKFPEPKGGEEVSITFPWVFQVAGADE